MEWLGREHSTQEGKPMKSGILSLATLVLLATCLSVVTHASSQVYDLKTDWSDTENPNGTWSYRDSGGALLTSNPFPWAYSCNEQEGIGRVSDDSIAPEHLELGDIFVLQGSCGITVRWAAPVNGNINVSGTAWGCSGLIWALKHNGTVLSGVDVNGIAGHTRDSPYRLSSGSGGAAALENIAVQAGDHIEMALSRWLAGCADSAPDGLCFTVTLTPDTVDSVAAIENLAMTVFEMNLQNGIENSLDGKLDAALEALSDVNVNNDGAACNSLAAFSNAVEAQRGKQINGAQADQLTASAQEIRGLLSCGN